MDFEDIKAAFWNKTVAFEVQAPLTDAMVARAGETLGVTLPDAFLVSSTSPAATSAGLRPV